MKRTTILTSILFFSVCSSTLFAQSNKQVTPQLLAQLSQQHQACLDKGDNMWECSNVFYHQMDSLLNMVYKSISHKLSPEAFDALKKEQLKWIGKRDKVYSDANRESKQEGLGITDASMVGLDREADFVKARIIFLIKTYL